MQMMDIQDEKISTKTRQSSLQRTPFLHNRVTFKSHRKGESFQTTSPPPKTTTTTTTTTTTISSASSSSSSSFEPSFSMDSFESYSHLSRYRLESNSSIVEKPKECFPTKKKLRSSTRIGKSNEQQNVEKQSINHRPMHVKNVSWNEKGHQARTGNTNVVRAKYLATPPLGSILKRNATSTKQKKYCISSYGSEDTMDSDIEDSVAYESDIQSEGSFGDQCELEGIRNEKEKATVENDWMNRIGIQVGSMVDGSSHMDKISMHLLPVHRGSVGGPKPGVPLHHIQERTPLQERDSFATKGKENNVHRTNPSLFSSTAYDLNDVIVTVVQEDAMDDYGNPALFHADFGEHDHIDHVETVDLDTFCALEKVFNKSQWRHEHPVGNNQGSFTDKRTKKKNDSDFPEVIVGLNGAVTIEKQMSALTAVDGSSVCEESIKRSLETSIGRGQPMSSTLLSSTTEPTDDKDLESEEKDASKKWKNRVWNLSKKHLNRCLPTKLNDYESIESSLHRWEDNEKNTPSDAKKSSIPKKHSFLSKMWQRNRKDAETTLSSSSTTTATASSPSSSCNSMESGKPISNIENKTSSQSEVSRLSFDPPSSSSLSLSTSSSSEVSLWVTSGSSTERINIIKRNDEHCLAML